MKLHIYDNSEQGEHFRAVGNVVAGIVAKKNIFQHRSIAGLITGLRWYEWDDPVIMFTDSDAELDQLLAQRAYLSNCRIILVLHDDKVPTLTKGHKLRPRLLFSQPVGAETLAAVIARIAGSAARTSRPPGVN